MLKKKNKVPLALIPLVSFVIGFLEQGSASAARPADTLLTLQVILSVALIFIWFWLDARERGYRASWGLRIMMLLLTVIALPYYLFKSRGCKHGFKSMGWLLLILLGTLSCYRWGSLLGAGI